MSASTFTSPGSITMYGETFHPRPSLRAGLFTGSGDAIAPLPFSPVGFSGLIERLSALDRIGRLPICMPRPLNDAIARDSSLGSFRLATVRDPPSQNHDRMLAAKTSTAW